MIALDLSGSRKDGEVSLDQMLLDSVVQGLAPGDQFVLFKIPGSAGEHTISKRTQTLPKARNPSGPFTIDETRRLHAVRADMRRDIDELLGERVTAKKSGTDVLGALFRVSDLVKEAGKRTSTVVLLSDMVQEAGDLNFTRISGIPREEWLEKQGAAQLLPDLSNICVTAIGPDTSTKLGVDTRQFWERYFNATGARFARDRYRRTAEQFDALLCNR
jgi:hypothetical protein